MPNSYYRVENRQHELPELPAGENKDFALSEHRKRIEPWLSAIFQAEHLNLLLGNGFSMGLSLAVGATAANMGSVKISSHFDAQITEAARKASNSMGRGNGNIEDIFRTAIAMQPGLDAIGHEHANELRTGLRTAIGSFASSIVGMEAAIIESIKTSDEKRAAFHRLLTEFLLSFASRTATRDRLHIFTTNYDRMIEYGCDLIGARPIDRFVGSLAPRFRASRFDVDIHYTPPGGRSDARPLEGVVRLSKLHGSIDWRSEGQEIVRKAVPFGGPMNLGTDEPDALMIFPNAAKDIETAFYPYAELFRDFSAALCRPNSAIVTYGYGFGDDHVNRVLRDMLTLPSTHLVIISFDDADGRIPQFIAKSGRAAQISLLIGPELAGLEPLVDNFLPKPAIDTITERETRLLESRRRPDTGTIGKDDGESSS